MNINTVVTERDPDMNNDLLCMVQCLLTNAHTSVMWASVKIENILSGSASRKGELEAEQRVLPNVQALMVVCRWTGLEVCRHVLCAGSFLFNTIIGEKWFVLPLRVLFHMEGAPLE